MKRKTLLTLCLLAVATLGTWAQGPNGSGKYYQNADGKSGAELKTALKTIISKQTKSPSYDDFIELYKKTDTRADGKVRDWYSNITNYVHVKDKAGSYKKEGDCYNREHLVPQDWGAGKAGDIMYVVPTDGYVNNKRSNHPLGEVGKNPSYQSANGYSKLGSCITPGYSGTVFEPNDEVKGDIARIYFYMTTRYEDKCLNWSGDMFTGETKYEPLAKWAYDMLVRWSQLDPIDDVEIARNNAIAKSDVQGNRNPFVDYPGLEDYIWGDKKDVPFSYDNYESGGGVIAERVEQPVFTPDGGTFADSVVVTISCATDSATIYYTTNGTEPSETAHVYEGPVTLKETTTLKAIAMRDSMRTSFQTSAKYTIITGGVDPINTDEIIFCLNNTTFGTNFSGTVKENGNFTATKDGITITYSIGSGSYQYINDSQIRLYAGNTFTVSTVDGSNVVWAEFTLVKNDKNKIMQASTGDLNDLIWTGSTPTITFSVNSGSGNMQLSHLKVKRATIQPEPKQGDVNGDGSVDVADIATIIDVMAGHFPDNITPGTDPYLVADVNGDGQVDVADIGFVITVMAGGEQVNQ